MHVRIFLVATLWFAVLLVGCSRGSILVISDPYWLAGRGISSPVLAPAKAAAAASGYSLRVREVAAAASVSAVEDAVKSAPSVRLVVLSPLLSHVADGIASNDPQLRIAAFSAQEENNQSPPENLIALVSTPDNAFVSAGVYAARFAESASRGVPAPKNARSASASDDTGRAPAGSGATAGAHGGTVVSIFLDDAVGQAESDAFASGYGSAGDSETLDTIFAGGDVDRNKLRTAITSHPPGSVALFVLAAPGYDAFVLDALKTDQTPIMMMNWEGGADYSNKVVYTMDEDVAQALRKVVETIGHAADNRIGIPWNIGPYRPQQPLGGAAAS
jgi:hypothetical protein